ncbi:MAG: CdaR family protein, partial [Chloroflexi bacterium]|nr:CdaR family protein [Chloroflexota bacterium]
VIRLGEAGGRLLRRSASGFVLSLRDNWNLGLLALVISSVLWVIITTEQNPPQTGAFNSLIKVEPVNVPPDYDVLKDIESVVVRITAPLDLWRQLSPDGFRGTVDLSGLSAGEHEVAVRVEARDGRVRVNDVYPSKVKVELDALRRQTVPVKVNVQQPAPFGYSAEEPRLSADRALVIGPAQLVSSVDAVVADVNLSAARNDVKQSFRLTPRTARGYDVDGVTVDPQTVTVEIPVKREINFQSFAVVAEVRNAPAAGYWFSRANVRPATVTVIGPKELLQPLTYLKTQPVDLSNISATVLRQAPIELPSGVTVIGGNTVEVELVVLPLKGAAPLRLVVRPDGLPTGRAIVNPEALAVEVVIAGEGPAMLDLSPDKVQATADLRGLGPGTHQVEPKFQAPAGLTVQSFNPRVLNITVR